VTYFGALKKRNWDRHRAVGRREKPKERIQGKAGSRKKLAAAGRGMTPCVGVALRKVHGRQGHVRGETSGETGWYQWNKEPRLKEGTTSEEREDIRQDLQENSVAGDLEANSRIFRQNLKYEGLWHQLTLIVNYWKTRRWYVRGY
jgi:hypothetical protein